MKHWSPFVAPQGSVHSTCPPISLQCLFTGMAQDLPHPITFTYLGVATGFGKRSFAFCGAQLQWNLLPSDPRQTKHPTLFMTMAGTYFTALQVIIVLLFSLNSFSL